MGKIVCLMGKSSTGKDTIYKGLLSSKKIKLEQMIPYTTRPIRDGETEGKEYHFVDLSGFQKLKESGKVIEDRCYQTCHGPWWYFTVDDGSLNLEENLYVFIGTLEAYGKIKEYYGSDKVIPILIEVDDGVRLQRALDRERNQDEPKYEEMCRRFLADSEDFSLDKIEKAGIEKNFMNDELKKCIQEIEEYIIQNR